jgi:integrase/recombinase XerC
VSAQLVEVPVDLVEGYLAHLRAGGASPGTLKVRASYLRRLDDSLPRGLLLATRAELTAFLATSGWAQETRHSVRSAMRGFYQWAEDEELLGKDPSRRLPSVRVPAGVPHPVPELVLAEALESVGPETRLMLLLGAYAGLRLAEIAQVHSDHIEATGLRVLGKGRKTRMVPLHPRLVEAMDGLEGFAFPAPVALADLVLRLLLELGGRG